MRPLPSRARIQESELILLLKHRQERGFGILYEQYTPNLLGVAMKIVRSPAIAQDVVQEAFIKIWRSFDAYDKGKGRLFTWLLAVVRNTALDQLRAQRANSGRSMCVLPSGLPSPEEGVSRPAAAQYLAVDYTPVDHIGLVKVLAALSLEHQYLIEYLYFRGYRQAEVAQSLRMPLGSVKTKLRTAMLQLRKQVGQELTCPPENRVTRHQVSQVEELL